jgi:hypothetical protein
MTSTQREPPALDQDVLAEFRARRGDLWAYCTDLDVQTALALARALVRTVLDLSPESQVQMVQSLTREIMILEQQADPISMTVATTLKQYFPGA